MLACTVLAPTMALLSGTAGTAAAAPSSLGVYTGPGYVSQHDAFAAWLPASVPYASDALDHRYGWSDISSPIWLLDSWSPWVRAVPGRRLVLSVPLLPASASGQLTAGAAGNFDSYFRTLAQNMVNRGLGGSIIRLGWEANGNWFPWAAAPDPASWKAFYRRVVATMRSVPGTAFAFDWNAASSAAGTNLTLDAFYPGNDVVDIVGLDAYDLKWGDSTSTPDQRWNFTLYQFNGLITHRDFANAQGKPLSFPEWGLYAAGDVNGGGGDNPYYIDRMADWFAANNVAYQSYFNWNWGGGDLNSFPNGKARYQARFASGGTTTTIKATTTTTTTKVTTTTTVAPVTTTTVAPATTTTTSAPKKQCFSRRRACR